VKARLLVCDLDNTLYDWVGYFVPAFYAMVDEVVRLTGCNRETLLDDFRNEHRARHDSEHPFALLDTETIRALYGNYSRTQVAEALAPAFKAFDKERNERLRLYPRVRETLEALIAGGVTLVAHTESKLNAVVDRLTRLDITQYFRHIYCRERAEIDHPGRWAPSERFRGFPLAKVSELSHHQRKPDPSVLLEICAKEAIEVHSTAYVGDSLVRDVYLGIKAGACSIWAKYGEAHTRDEYEKLVRISHWSPADVARERELSRQAGLVRPDYVLKRGFYEILDPLEVANTLTRNDNR
jgi:FMN phosphatase YigB (HAD superfamily)